MDFSQPFSVLNEQLKPRVTCSQRLHSSLNRLEDRQLGSLRSRSACYRPTVLPAEPNVFMTEPEVLLEPGDGREQEDLTCGSLLSSSCLLSDLNVKDEDESELVGDATGSEEKDGPGELAPEGEPDPSSSEAGGGVGGSPFQRCFFDGSLPDLIRTGRTLGRRRTLGHVSDTLKEVRREVELSRRRSIKLKAQVDRLQEGRDGVGWSHHRERVTEEVLSILRLLHPLMEPGSGPPGSGPPGSSDGPNGLDAALSQLQNVARKLAISHTKQELKPGEHGAEDAAILQQALRDRDEAIEKKKAMEGEVLRSKTEMMALNNHLLEAAQKRLELSLELEAWKDDFQRLLQQQVYSQQQAEQAQKKTSRLGLLRRNNKPPIQRPPSFPLSAPTPPTVSSSHIFLPPSSPTTRHWMDKLKKGKSGRHGDQAAPEQEARGRNDGFQVVSLD
ncbi:bicaudal-D-related protein 2-like [Leuresthes tenuis]|uniref:bicaudal-D-related protein 2-like n=1 Tax=Leuresthes tenuis TaxID=355514 RepID=UPI003B508B6E